MAGDGAGGGADGGRAEDGRREDDPYRRARGGAPPGAVAGGGLVLVFVDLAVGVLGDHGSVVGADQAAGVQILDDLVVILRSGFVRVRCDENERAVGVGHGALLVLVAGCWTFSYSLGQRLAPFHRPVCGICGMLPGCRSSGTLVAGLSAARGPGTVTADPDWEGVRRATLMRAAECTQRRKRRQPSSTHCPVQVATPEQGSLGACPDQAVDRGA